MEKLMNRRKALGYTLAAAASLGVVNSGFSGEDNDIKMEGGWFYMDKGYEKHIPEVTVNRKDEIAEITVQVKHPQNRDHHISAFKIYTDERIEITSFDLNPELSTPKATFYLKIAQGTSLIAITDCNIHGIWMKRFEV